MNNRRHFGSVRKLPSGRWQAGYWHNGARFTAERTFDAKADAQAWLSSVETDIGRGGWIDPGAGIVTLGTFALLWLAGRSDLRPTTRAKYAGLLRLHIVPALGNAPIAKVTALTVRAWYHDLAEKHQTTADDSYRLLRAILNTAVADAVIARSPCQVKGAGQVRSPERPVASVAELAAAVEALPDRLRTAALLAAWCQLRRGEVLGLQRRDVNLMHRTLRVERAWLAPLGSAPVLGPPKTDAGRRTITIPGNVMPVLQDHLERFVAIEAESWLFATSTGTAVSPRNFTRAWSTARAAAGRPDLHLHDLRHSGLTWAAATGASTAELMRRGGHINPRAALRYQHATEDRDRVLADALAGLASPAEVTQLRSGTRDPSRT